MSYSVSYSAQETSANVRGFIKQNYSHFWEVIIKVIPLVLLLYIFTMFVSGYIFEAAFNSFAAEGEPSIDILGFSVSLSVLVGGLNVFHMALNGYLMAVIAISWHRLVINGEENYRRMFVFMPRWHEIQFMLLLALLHTAFYGAFFSPVLIMQIPGFEFIAGSVVYVFPVMMLVLACVALFLFFKCSFYFPAKAANRRITIVESFRLTRGYFGKIVMSYIRASWRLGVVAILYMVVLMFFMSSIMQFVFSSMKDTFLEPNMFLIQGIGLVLNLPFIVFLGPMFLVIGVTIISNYYLHAVQNKDEAI